MSFRFVCFALGLALAAIPTVRADDPAAKFQIDRDRSMFADIRDNTSFQGEDVNHSEAAAYNTVLLHARQFPTAEMETHARRDVTFKDLIFNNRDEFRLQLVYFEGRLRMLRRTDPPRELKEAGVADMYEAWLFPKDEVNPICVILTELPPGLSAQKDRRGDEIGRWVGFAGYSFKLFQYESQQVDAKNPTRNVVRKAPLLLGRSVTVAAETADDTTQSWRTSFLPVALAGFGGLGLVLVGLAWWFRRGDRAARAAIAARAEANPFAPAG